MLLPQYSYDTPCGTRYGTPPQAMAIYTIEVALEGESSVYLSDVYEYIMFVESTKYKNVALI